MKKRNFWAKCIAFLLVVVMVLSEQNITTLGETIGSYAQERMAGSSEQETERAIIKEDSSQESSSADGSSSSSSETSQAESSATQNDSQQTQQTGKNSDAGSAQTDQGTSAPSGQQALTDGASDVDNAGAQNEKKTADDKKNNRQNAQKKQKAKTEEQNDANQQEENQDAENNSASLDDTIRDYYGDVNSTEDGNRPTASVTIKQIGEELTDIKTGQTIDFKVEYTLTKAAYFSYGEQRQPLFDTYDETKIYLTLPDGISIIDDENLKGITLNAPEENSPTNTWTLELPSNIDASQDNYSSFTLTMMINGNGTYEDKHVFDFGESQNMMQIETFFTVKDRTDASDVTDKGRFHKVIGTESKINDDNKLTAVTEDAWMVKKTPNGYEVSDDNETVTVRFKLEVGLTSDGTNVITSASNYELPGRVPFANENNTITLLENPSVLNRNNQPIQAESIKVIPQFDNTDDSNTIEVTNEEGKITFPQTLTIPVDTCEGKTDSAKVDPNAPYYSEYIVEVVYPYADFVAHYSDTNQEQLDVNNTATINYQLKGQDQKTSDSTATVKVGDVIQPATLILKKMIQDSDGNSKPYTITNFDQNDPVKGSVEYTITNAEDDTTPTLYQKNADGSYSVKENATNGKVTYDLGATGEVIVYLDPGNYIVRETRYPSKTEPVTNGTNNANARETGYIDEEESVTETFYNKELLGEITITKKETGTNTLLDGAEFGLYEDETCTKLIDTTKKTGEDGTVVFNRLDYDETSGTTYYVKEIAAPEGYLIDDKNPMAFTISKGDLTAEKTVYNTPNEASVVLQKRVFNPTTGKYENVGLGNYTDFFGKFELQQFVKDADHPDGAWIPVEKYSSPFGVGQEGKSETFALPVYESDGNLIRYRFKETLPEGYHAAGEKVEGTVRVYSQEFNLEGCLAEDYTGPKTVTIDNTRNGSITLTKNFYTAGNNGIQQNTDGTLQATFDLYAKKGGKVEKVNTDSYTVTNSADGKSVTINDLPRTYLPDTGGDAEGQPIKYYLVETSPSAADYISSEAGGVNTAEKTRLTIPSVGESGNQTETTVEAYGPFDFTQNINTGTDESQELEIVLEQSITINNVENKVPVVVKKVNSYDYANNKETFVPGAKYSIYLYDNDKKAASPLEGYSNVEITSVSGSLAKLETGHKYIIEETVTPSGYENVTDSEDLIIDLTGDNATITAGMPAKEVVLLNRSDPSFRVSKVRVNADGTTTSLNKNASEITPPAQFEVYTSSDGGKTFKPVPGAAEGSILTITAGETVQITDGTYYLKEIVPKENPNGILDPSISFWKELYPETVKQADGTNKRIGVRTTDDSFYFGPYTVQNQQAVQDFGTITNYSNTGAVTVKKEAMDYDGTTEAQDGATIEITSADGSITETGTTRNGQVTFTGLPIYDASGNKIVYTIKETAAPNGYTVSDTKFTVTLTPGETVIKDNTSPTPVDLKFVNQPTTEFKVNKVYYNAWEHAFTDKTYPLPGTEVALYQWVENDSNYPEGIYKYVTKGTTDDETGSVTFSGLAQDVKYVAIEVSIPDDVKYQYLEPNGPDGGKDYLEYVTDADGQSKLPDTLTADKLSQYNYVVKDENTTANNPVELTTRTLENVENWTQLHIKKFVKEIQNNGDNEIGDERLINNAEFNLYMQVLPDDTVEQGKTESGAVLSFNKEANPEQYTLIGTYSSGTLYNTNGERLDGWFGTDILKSADNVVYWLEETKAGIGAEIRPTSVYTLIYRDGMNYSNETPYTPAGDAEQVTCQGAIKYYDSTVSTGAIENDPLYGGNGAMFSTVRIAKWAGSRTANGGKENIFSPLGNVNFDLYLTDANGTQIQLLDTLTTGLDNTTIGDYLPEGSTGTTEGDIDSGTDNVNAGETGEETTEEGLTAWASSKAFSFQEICDFAGGLESGIDRGIIVEDKAEDDTVKGYFVRVALEEGNAPNGYLAEKNIYYMYMYFSRELFGSEGDTTEDGEVRIKTTEIFNDAYYVQDDGTTETGITNADEQEKVYQWALYPTTEQKDGTYSPCTVENAPSDADTPSQQYRLVNWPVDTQAVTVQKYGYTVNEAEEGGNLKLTSEGLDAYYGVGSGHTDREPISVKMKLQRYVNNQWQDWAYETTSENADSKNTDSENKLGLGEFITNDAGYFAFPEGLQMGYYRIVEIGAEGDTAENYELIYDGSDVKKDNTADTPYTPKSAAYYFQVKDDSVHITMYNPDKQDLTIKKTDMETTPLSEVGFTLKNNDNNDLSVQGKTATDGKVTLSKISTGTHILSESVDNSEYSGTYFEQYFKETYANYNNANGKGGKLSDLVDNGIFLGYDFALQSDSNGTSVIVTNKTDISDYGIDRSSGIDLNIKNPKKVSFTVRKTDADTEVVKSGAKFDIDYILFESTNGTEINIAADATWKSLRKDATTDNNGLISIENAEPGIYRITETAPPTDYDRNLTPQYIVITGGLNIGTVKVNGNVIAARYTGAETDGITVEFTNEKQVNLTVTKEIAAGNMGVTGNHEFTFTLYDSNKKQIGEPKEITVNGNGTGIATFTGLSQGATYYLKETGIASGFKLTGMTGTGAKITNNGDGYYKIEVPNTTGAKPADISVTATNTYLYGQVSFLKVNGETGKKLTGATFQIKRVKADGSEEDVSTTITDNKDGSYTAVILLSDNKEETFRIYEATAPKNYLLSGDMHLEFKLKPGTVLGVPEWKTDYAKNNDTMLQNRIFPNYQGAYIDLTKYDNVHDAATKNTLADVKFTLYKQNADGTWNYVQDKTTEDNGSLRFVVDSGVYALEENLPENSEYQGLEGIYNYKQGTNVAENTIEATIQTGNATETKILHQINGGQAVVTGTEYTYSAYNIPYIPLTIEKYNSDTSSSTRLTAKAAVYEVPAEVVSEWGAIDQVTDEQVTTFINEYTPLIDDIDVSTQSSTDGRPHSYADSVTKPELGRTLVAGKTYLVVEKTAGVVGDTAGGAQIRGNEKVQWYDIVQTEAGTTTGQTAALYNVEGKASLTLDKTVDDTAYTSLFTQAAEVEYTITPTVNNTYPLMAFTVEDTGLTAFGKNGRLSDDYLKDKYSLTQVKIEKASHEVSDYSELSTAPINATVTFKNSEGQAIDVQTVENVQNLSENGATVTLSAGKGKAAQVSISYESPTFKANTKKEGEHEGYALGANFNPGDVTITAMIDQQTGGSGREAITKINNKASSTLSYYEWNADGTEADNTTSITKEDDVDVNFAEQKAPKIAVNKTSDEEDGTAALNSTTTYSIKIENQSTDGAVFQNPFIVDYLPQGTSWVLDSNSNVDVKLKEDTGVTQPDLTIGDIVTQPVNGEKAVLIYLNGELDAGESVTVDLKVKIDNTVTAYGTTMYNYALVGSTNKGAQSTDNPYAASFKNSTGNWPDNVDTLLGQAISTERLTTLKELLGGEAGDGFVMDSANLNWTTASESVLVKSAYGDRNANQGYTTNVLSTVNNIIAGQDGSGTMHYRLAVSNTSSDYKTTNLSVIDILPNVGDYTPKGDERESAWGLTFNNIDRVYVNGQKDKKINIKTYYYTGTVSGESQYTKLYNDVLTISYDTEESALPEGWTSTLPNDKTTIKAFIVTTDSSVQLDNTDSLYIEYTAKVKDGINPWTEEELSNNSWKNAVNNFACTYSQLEERDGETVSVPEPLNKVLESNEVSATTMPNPVKVGGNIWIDKNGDGVRDTGEEITAFAGNILIEDMLSKVEVNLNTYHGDETSASVTPYGGSLSTSTANYVFDNLDPAMVRDNWADADVYPNGTLSPNALKGTSPATYTIDVDIPDSVKGIYEVTSRGQTCGRSNHPDELSTTEQTDNNFIDANASGNTKAISATSERFYLWPTDVTTSWDNTKDFAVIPQRTLTITKQAADQNKNAVNGARFRLYGPFAEDDNITAESLSGNYMGTYMTANGQVEIDNLLWFQKYVIVEESTAEGYTLEDAAVNATSGGTNVTPLSGVEINEEEKPAWILGVPDKTKNTPEDTVTITNKKIPTETTLGASKTVTGKSLTAGEFTFKLWDSTGANIGDALQTKVNDKDGNVTFDKISYDSEGTYTYYITEELPTEAQGANPYEGIKYDEAIYRATVNVKWTDGKGLEVESVAYEKKVGDAWAAVGSGETPTFTNEYTATGSWTPEGSKTLTGRDMKENETFTFYVKKNDSNGTIVSRGTAQGGDNGENVTIDFAPISYNLNDVGEHTYTIVEYIPTEAQTTNDGKKVLDGVVYDQTSYEVTVKVEDKGDGTLTVTPTYPENATKVSFTNNYIPTPDKYAPAVSKILTGHELPVTKKDFTFTLTADANNPEGATLPQNNTATVSFENKKEGTATGFAKFGDITFTKGGTYNFTIQETTETAGDGYTYDTTQWTLTVVVTDDLNGTLSIDTATGITYDKNEDGTADSTAAEFTNDYTPASTTTRLEVSKEVEGAPMAKDATFTFTQSLVNAPVDGVAMPGNDTVEITVVPENADNADANKAQFDPITFTKAGIYEFHITEETNTLPDGYDKNISNIKLVEVTVEDVGGELEVTGTKYYTSTDSTGVTTGNAAFTNRYNTEDTVFTPEIKKIFTGDVPTGKKTFTFTLTRGDSKDGVQMPGTDPDAESITTSVTYDSNIGDIIGQFGQITFTKAGEYTFNITEVSDGTDDGYTYDGSTWTLTVKVEDQNSKLKVTEHKYTKAGSPDSTSTEYATFTNTYDLIPTDFAPKVTKTIEGAAVPDDIEAIFTFELTNVGETDGVDLKEGATKTLEVSTKDMEDGSINAEFADRLHFTKAGTYTFQIAETAGSQNGYTYDDSIWNLTVTVEDKGGYLEVTDKTYAKANVATGQDDGENEDHATFTNTYVVTPDTFTPQVEKQFSDDSVTRPTAKDFTFKLTADEQNPAGGAFTGYDETTGSGTALEGANTIETEVNGSGTGAFDIITFTKAGTYKFRIQEEAGSDLGYTYDDAVWTLTVQVDDIGGALQVTNNDVTYQSNDTTVEPNNEKAVFVNEYHYISSIIINKEVLRGNAEYETNDMFYAGIFRKVDNTGDGTGSETGNISYEIVKNVVVDNMTVESGVVQLANNGRVEVYVPLGGEDQTEAITYYVFETDAEGHPLVSFDEDGNAVYNQPFVYEISSESTGEDGTVNGRGEVYVTPDTAGAHPKVTITNRATSVSIEKRDISGNPLTGAVLELWKQADSVDAGVAADEDRTKAANGDILLETWTSDGTPHELTAELAVGGTYYLREAEVPAGYVQAADILFTVENGDPITLIMEDENQANVLGQIQVTKRLSAIDETTFDNIDLVAEDATVYVGLFTDAQGEHPYGEDYVKEIHIQDASSGTVTFDNLPSGTYYVFETQQDGTVIPYGELQADAAGSGAGFICAGDGSNGGVKEITLNPDTGAPEGSTELGNVYYGDLPDGFAYQGELMITKAVMKDGAPADSSDTFYAGIFTSETETVPYKVVALENNGTVTVEVPLGGANGMDPVTYYIYETDADGNKIDKNSFAYTVSGEGTVDLDVDNTTAGRTIINTMASDPDTTRTIREKNDSDTKKISTDTSKKSTGTNRRTSSSKTGDDTRVGLYLLFFAAAAVGIILTLRKRKEDKPE